MEKGEKLKNFIKTTIRELLMEDKDVDVFGHKLSVLLHMIDDQVDKPKQVIKNKINELLKIKKQASVALYRVVYIKNPDKLSKTNFGHHYVSDIDVFQEEMLDYLYQNARELDKSLEEEDAYLIEVETPTSNIDYYETMKTFALHPFENEITIKDDKHVSFKNITNFFGTE
jgi:hypothetical protein